MARWSWMVAGLGVAGLVLAATPFACVIVDNGPPDNGNGGQATGGSTAGGADQCNPVTGAGCAVVTGESCDLNSETGLFSCFPPPNSAPVCGDCDEVSMPCGSESTCVQASAGELGTCYRYCCTNDDCGAGGTCDTGLAANYLQQALPSDKVGLCVQGGGPACTPPASAPSGGSCIGGYRGGGDGGTSGGDGGFGDGGHGGHGDAGQFGGGGGTGTGDGGGSGAGDGGGTGTGDGGGTGPADAGTD